MTQIYKAVFQLPADSMWRAYLAEDLWWQEGDDPHGPHIKIYPDKHDAETGEPCVHVRCKHRSLDELLGLMEKVTQAIKTEMK